MQRKLRNFLKIIKDLINLIKALAFDLQFTLVFLKNFSLRRWFEIFDDGFNDVKIFLRDKGFEFEDKKLYRALRLKRNKYFAQTITDDQRYYTEEILSDTFSKMKIDLSEEDFTKCVQLYHGKEILAWKPDPNLSIPLQKIIKKLSNEYRLAIITNAIEYVTNGILRIQKIQEYFELVIPDARKPRLPCFKVFQEKMSVKTYEQVMIGDDIKADIEPAINLGMKTIHLHRGYEYRHDDALLNIKPNKKIKSLDEIFKVLEEL